MKYLGIDWATDIHFVALVDQDGGVIGEWQVAHDPTAVAGLIERLGSEGGSEAVLVGIESGAPLVVDQLLEVGYRVYALNPKQADRFRDRYSPAGAKDDRRDALVVANAVRTDADRLRLLEPDSALTQQLRLRDRARTRLVAQRTRYAHQLRQTLARYYPALLKLGRDMHDRFLLALLQAYPDPAAGRAARTPRLQRLLKSHRIRVLSVQDLRSRLRSQSFFVPDHVVEACRDEALDLVAHIELVNEQIDVAERRLRELFKKHPDRELLESLPGLGDNLTIRVAAELGDHRAREGDASKVQAFGGTAPVTRRSGKRHLSVRMRRGCNRNLQGALFQMARCSVPKSRWAASYLQHLRDRGVPYNKAVRALSNKWVKILVMMLNTRATYDDNLHIDHLVRNQVPWAQHLNTQEQIAA